MRGERMELTLEEGKRALEAWKELEDEDMRWGKGFVAFGEQEEGEKGSNGVEEQALIRGVLEWAVERLREIEMMGEGKEELGRGEGKEELELGRGEGGKVVGEKNRYVELAKKLGEKADIYYLVDLGGDWKVYDAMRSGKAVFNFRKKELSEFFEAMKGEGYRTINIGSEAGELIITRR